MPTPTDLVTQSEAARLTGRTRSSVNRLIARKRIPCYGPDRLVSLADVRDYRPLPAGPPRKTPDRR